MNQLPYSRDASLTSGHYHTMCCSNSPPKKITQRRETDLHISMPCGWVPVQLQAQITLDWVFVGPLAGVLFCMGSNGTPGSSAAGEERHIQRLAVSVGLYPHRTLSHAILAPFR